MGSPSTGWVYSLATHQLFSPGGGAATYASFLESGDQSNSNTCSFAGVICVSWPVAASTAATRCTSSPFHADDSRVRLLRCQRARGPRRSLHIKEAQPFAIRRPLHRLGESIQLRQLMWRCRPRSIGDETPPSCDRIAVGKERQPVANPARKLHCSPGPSSPPRHAVSWLRCRRMIQRRQLQIADPPRPPTSHTMYLPSGDSAVSRIVFAWLSDSINGPMRGSVRERRVDRPPAVVQVRGARSEIRHRERRRERRRQFSSWALLYQVPARPANTEPRACTPPV